MDLLFEVKHHIFTVKYFIYILSIHEEFLSETIIINLFEYFILNTLNQAASNYRYTEFKWNETAELLLIIHVSIFTDNSGRYHTMLKGILNYW